MERRIRGLSQYCRSTERAAPHLAKRQSFVRSVSPALSRSSAEGRPRSRLRASESFYSRFGSHLPTSSDADEGWEKRAPLNVGARQRSRSYDMSRVPADVPRPSRVPPKAHMRWISVERRPSPVERRTSPAVSGRSPSPFSVAPVPSEHDTHVRVTPLMTPLALPRNLLR